eukprot:gene4778-18435_t
MGAEKATFVKALFFVVTSMTTVGYGTTGSAPTTDGAKVFASLWLGFSTLALANMASKIISYKLDSKIHRIRDRVLTHAFDRDFFSDLDQINKRFDDLDTNKSGRLTPKELGISLAAPANTPA